MKKIAIVLFTSIALTSCVGGASKEESVSTDSCQKSCVDTCQKVCADSTKVDTTVVK